MSSDQPINPEQKKIKKAVALKYEPGERSAPVMVAKGKGQTAEHLL
jgi:flagellar biosynthesis protein